LRLLTTRRTIGILYSQERYVEAGAAFEDQATYPLCGVAIEGADLCFQRCTFVRSHSVLPFVR